MSDAAYWRAFARVLAKFQARVPAHSWNLDSVRRVLASVYGRDTWKGRRAPEKP